MSTNFQALLDVVKATKLLPLQRFDMSEVFYVDLCCGTVGCMIGNYNALVNRGSFQFGSCGGGKGGGDWDYFGITKEEYFWLFAERASDRYELVTNWSNSHLGLKDVTRKQAIARLRKLIYYKLHKHEMCHDQKYGVRDEARRAEGNHGFTVRALAHSTH